MRFAWRPFSAKTRRSLALRLVAHWCDVDQDGLTYTEHRRTAKVTDASGVVLGEFHR